MLAVNGVKVLLSTSLLLLATALGAPGEAQALAVECSTCHVNHGTNYPVGRFCGECHGMDHTTAHDKTILPDTSCSQCHVANVRTQHAKFYNPTYLKTDPNTSKGCIICHNATYDAVIALAKGPTGIPVDCFACHTSADHLAAHDFVSTAPNCASCHVRSVVAEHGSVCATCHNSTNPTVVQAITDGKAGTPVTCENCHGAGFTHPTATHSKVSAADSCVTCHTDSNIINGVHSGNCVLCHTSTRPEVIQAIVDGKAGTQVNCQTCHTGHADLAADHNNLDAVVDCATCHRVADFTGVLATHQGDCATCHASARQAVVDTIAAGKGASGVAVNCANCHGTHDGTTAHNNLLTNGSCSTCHATGTFTTILTTHRSDCAKCHTSTRPEVVSAIDTGKGASGQPVDCESCHGGHTNLAGDHNNLDAVVDCATCHKIGRASCRERV